MFRLRLLLAVSLSLYGHAAAADSGSDSRFEVRGRAFDAEVSLTFVGAPVAQARQAGAEALAEIERLEALLSTGRPDSELARLNQRGSASTVSPALSQLLQLCERWRERTGNAFSCRLGALMAIWRQAATSGEVPERSELRRKALAIGDGAWQWSPTATSPQELVLPGWTLEPGELSLAFAIDAALARARAVAPQATGIRVDAGSFSASWGSGGGVAIAEPRAVDHSSDHRSDHDYGVLTLESRAVAFSDGGGWQVGNRRFGRIVDPAEGWPVEFAPSAVVVAPDAATAHALATALVVMPAARGLALIDHLPEVEALVITESGKTFASSGWYRLLQPDDRYRSPWPEEWQFRIGYQIPVHQVSEYRRPYVAIWITDADGGLVRQLRLHGDSPRWLREIALWWRRYGRRDESVIDGLARPTVKPGRQTLVWDGRDDSGRRAPEGRYVLQVEAAREHGERELVSLPFELSGRPFELRAKGDKELGSIEVGLASRSVAKGASATR